MCLKYAGFTQAFRPLLVGPAGSHRAHVADGECESSGQVRHGGGFDALHQHVELTAAGEADREGIGVGVAEPRTLRGPAGVEDLAAQVVDGSFDAATGDAAGRVAVGEWAVPGGRGALPLPLPLPLPLMPTTVARAKGRALPHHECSVSAMFSMDGPSRKVLRESSE